MLDKNIKNIYFIGIKGVGMTMLAQFLSKSAIKIYGSDVSETFMTDKVLKDSGIKVFQSFSENNIKKVKNIDLIIYSSAYNVKNNIELKLALGQKKILILSYAQALAELFNGYKGIAVVGSHGKTTVSAWLAFVLKNLKQSPNALIGANVPQFSGSGLKGKSKYLIAEVDEYQNKLKYFKPFGVVLNNIDWDHYDYFKTFDQYLKVFVEFVKKIPTDGFLVYNYDDKNCREVAKYCKGKKMGFSLGSVLEENSGEGKKKNKKNITDKNNNILRVEKNSFVKGKAKFSFSFNNKKYSNYNSGLIGAHNLSNSLAVLLAANSLDLDFKKVKIVLNKFIGTSRRQEILGKYKGCLMMDDYAHHPTEIKKTLEALRCEYKNKKIFVVFHPHTYTRTKILLDDFSKSFSLANKVFVLAIYGSAREKTGGVSSHDLVEKIKEYNKKKKIAQEVKFSGKIEETIVLLKKEINENVKEKPIILLMGAGDVFRVGESLLKKN
jgi:UDP-N-acetylmuramate--alanine ligase